MSASHLRTVRLSRTTQHSPAAAVPSRQARARAQAPLVLGRYRLHRRLGAGAFGTVWMACDERLDRDVAVKIVPRERIMSGRFEREARAAARLAHPGIVTLYEAAVDDEGAYLVSELVRGATLGDLLESGRLSDRDMVEIAIALCDALGHAHAEGIVHRDVKPSNILIPEHPATPAQLVKLTDFGVARVIGGDALTRSGDVVGTDAYMAPEQAEGREAGAAADLYALALVAYEGLTGINPVRTGTSARRARRLGAHLPPLRRQRRDLPRELGCAIDLALRPRPRERGTLEELRRALTASLPAMEDSPGVVTSAWPALARPEHGQEWAPSIPAREAGDTRTESLPAVPWSARGLAALASAAFCAWLGAHLLTRGPLAPAAAALLAAVAVAALPRVGWLVITSAVGALATVQGRPGAALILAVAALVPVLLTPRSGSTWPLGAGAVAFGLAGLAGAWPALAGRASGPWRRASIGACGWIWLVLAAPIHGAGLYLHQPAGAPSSVAGWSGSLTHTLDTVIRPILGSGALSAAPVWAAAAVVLPWLLRGRGLALQFVLVSAWSAMVVSATGTAISLVHSPDRLLGSSTAVAGAVAGALVALAPGAAEAVRTSRADAGSP
jgi:serine/threonine protein kinase